MTQQSQPIVKVAQPKPELSSKIVNSSNALTFTNVAPNKSITSQFFDLNKTKKSPMNQINSFLNCQSKPKTNIESVKSSTLAYKTKNISSPSPKVFQPINSLNSSQDLKQTLSFSKKKLIKDSNNKENKNDKNEITQFDETSFSSQKKNQRSRQGKSFSKTAFELNSNSSSQKSSNSCIKNHKQVLQGTLTYNSQSFLNPTKSLNLVSSNKSDSQNKFSLETYSSKHALIQKGTPSQTPFQVKLEKSRTITKSIERNKESKSSDRSRKVQKNFSSFTGTLNTEEETEFLFRNHSNTKPFSRPKTASIVGIEENNYILKGILSPKLNKSLVGKQVNPGPVMKCEKEREEKPQTSNSIKFLNDLLNKRKISCSSSDHLRMPKKPSFLGKKLESPSAQLVHKQNKILTKSDTFEARITNQIVKKTQLIPKGYVPSPCSSKIYQNLK